MATNNLKSKITFVLSVFLLSACTISPVVAQAANTIDGSATTSINIKADAKKIVASAPTQIALSVDGVGNIIAPEASSVRLENGSIYGIHVSNITAEERNGFNLDTGNDLVNLNIKPNNGAVVNMGDCLNGKTITTSDWNMTKDSDIQLTITGTASNITKDLSQAAEFGSISWTFTPGMI